MIAKIRLRDDLLIADISDGTQLVNCDAMILANMLWDIGITADDVSAIDHDFKVPMTGHMIAIFSCLRRLEMNLN